MSRTAKTLAVATIALISACYGTSASEEDEGAGGAASGGTNSTGARAGSTSRGGTSSAGTSSGGTDSGGRDSGGSDSGGTDSGSPGSGGVGGAPPPPPWELWRACSLEEDCTVIPINTCCGCIPTGVNLEYEEEAIASNAGFNAGDCPPLGCAAPPCPPDSLVACQMGACVPLPGCSQRSEQDCDIDGKCEKYLARLCSTPGEFAYFACGKPRPVCNDVLTCVVSPFGQEVLFPDSCVPDGYNQPCVSECL